MRYVFPAVMLATGALASCTTSGAIKPTPETYAAIHTMLEGSPGLRKHIQDKCATKVTTPQYKQRMSLLANVPPDKVQPVVCERLIEAVASGRLTYYDYTHYPTVTRIKVIQGR